MSVPTAVYRFYDAAGALLYVGIATQPHVRRSHHRRKAAWFTDVVSEQVVWFPDRLGAAQEEQRAIREEEPLHNKMRLDEATTIASATTWHHAVKDKQIGQFCGADEIGRMLGVNRQRVNQLAARDDFPEPLEVLAMGKVWAAVDIEKWAKKRGRTIHPY